MNKLFFFLFLCFFSSPIISAQNSPDCRSAIPVCADVPVLGFADGMGVITDFDPSVITQTGCLEKGSVSSANIENNTSWFVFRAGTTGQVGFNLEALSITAEWDFAVFGPDADCGAISNGSAVPIRCNYEVNTTSFTGIGINPENGERGVSSVTGNQNTYDEWLNVTAGEVYYILINNFNTNFDGDPEPFSLTFTGTSVNQDQNTALDCTLRDEFLGLDIIACEGDPDIFLSALRSPAGSDILSVSWEVDFEDDGVIDQALTGVGPFGAEYTVASPAGGRYYVTIETSMGVIITDDILITYYGVPILDEVLVLEQLSDNNKIEVVVLGNGDYEFAINNGDFQDSPIFEDVPPGVNTVLINDNNGCGTTDALPFLVVGFPKFFTPNGDAIHDTWTILGIETLTNPVVRIFDRFGKLLVELNAVNAWNGLYNGRAMPASDYWFTLDYEATENGVLVAKLLQNHFSLKR